MHHTYWHADEEKEREGINMSNTKKRREKRELAITICVLYCT
jgi:hypothetical protein